MNGSTVHVNGSKGYHKGTNGTNGTKKNGHNVSEMISHTNGLSFDDVQATADMLLSMTSHRPKIGIICGSGLGGLVEMLKDTYSIKYEDVPNFPVSTAPGHVGRLVFGELSGKTCICMQGRTHMYEGYPMWKVVFPIRVMKAMGVEILIATNAAGGLNETYKVGDLMIFKDHLNLPGMAGLNPLIGPNDEKFGPRFPALSDAYDKELSAMGKKAAAELGYDFVHEGVYCVQSGPCFETIAECRMLRILGADVTGMSTVPEVMTGRHCGLRCFAMTLVTNMVVCDYNSTEIADSDEVLETGRMRSKDCQNLITKLVDMINLKSA